MGQETAQGLVVGTAGHIDHGKTSLVRALTGIDTDRLAEEKKRGISIDLGFAHVTLPSGAVASFVDVPGHERFVKNMVAGVAGIQAVVLIVAADESVMPQTREHFQICRLLGVRDGFVVLTKSDLANSEQLRATRSDVADLVKGSFLAGKPVLAASSRTGDGLPDILRELDRLVSRAAVPSNGGIARLAVDRAFSLKGFGTVVTGTLTGNTLTVGATITLQPGARPVRIRGLQTHNHNVETAQNAQRTAVNLIGVEAAEIERGDVLTDSAVVVPSKVLAVALEFLPGYTPITTREEVLIHVGTAEVVAELKVLQLPVDNKPALAYLWPSKPVLAFPGDHVVVRRPSPSHTVAGGRILDIAVPLRLRRVAAVARLQRLEMARESDRIEIFASEALLGRTISELVRLTGIRAEQIRQLVIANQNLVLHAPSERVVTRPWLGRRRAQLVQWLTAFHTQNPSKPGAPVAVARLKLPPDLAALVVDGFSAVRVQGDVISLAAHRAEFNSGELAALQQLEKAFREGGFTPPLVADVLRAIAADERKARTLLESLIKAQKLVRISDSLVFHVDVIAHIRKSLSVHKGRRFSVPEFKEWTQISRKFAIPLLEYLDHQRVTKRDGDNRIVL